MAQRYKSNDIVIIPAPLMGAEDFVIDSPEFEITQGRQADNKAYIGVKYFYKQGSIDREVFVEYPEPFETLEPDALAAIVELITQANTKIMSMPQHAGATPIPDTV